MYYFWRENCYFDKKLIFFSFSYSEQQTSKKAQIPVLRFYSLAKRGLFFGRLAFMSAACLCLLQDCLEEQLQIKMASSWGLRIVKCESCHFSSCQNLGLHKSGHIVKGMQISGSRGSIFKASQIFSEVQIRSPLVQSPYYWKYFSIFHTLGFHFQHH